MMLEDIRSVVLPELEDVETEIQVQLRSDVSTINDVVSHMALYKGKRLRPILLLLCSGLAGGITRTSIESAAMIEILHTATLVHDDVIDESDLRRGGPSVNSIWGSKVSVLVGDFLYSRVLYRLSQMENLEVVDILSETIKRICEGELIQLQHGHNNETIDEGEYFELITNKTASLLATTCELGAISSGSNNDDRNMLRRFGEYLGVAFQIKDDLMDYVGAEEFMGKPVSKDLIENILTLPLLYGLRNSKDENRSSISTLLKTGIEEESLDTINRFARESGGIEYAEIMAGQYAGLALDCLNGYEDNIYKRSLINLTDFIVTRDY